ncbi:MAG: oxalate/formate MFS antiporter [Gemmatimonadetes bacterium]|nr:oxalate/formate MFS antiporter [Gemmatimonadota bacterium]
MTQSQAGPVEERIVNRWWQLAACILAMMAIANLQYAWTLFTIPLSEAFNVRLSVVQVAFTLFILFETWLVPVEGYLIDRFGARRIVSIGGVLVALGWIGSGFAQSVGQLYVWYAIGGVGAGAVYGASIGTALKWFPDHRGLAAGLAAGAYGFGTALTVLPISSMIDSSGYDTAFIVWGCIQGIVVLAAAQFLVKPPARWSPRGLGYTLAKRPQVIQATESSTPWQMVRTPTFWTMYIMMAMVAFGGLMVTAQLKPIAATFGLDKSIVFLGVTALGLALVLDRILNGVTRPFWGWVSDHIGRYKTMAIAFSLEATGIFALLQLIDRPVWFVILSGLVFFAWGEIYSLFPAAIGDVFGPEYATTNYGIQYTAKGTASIFAGWGAALLLERTGSWVPVFWVAIVCDLLAAGLAIFWLGPLVVRRANQQRAATDPMLRTAPAS